MATNLPIRPLTKSELAAAKHNERLRREQFNQDVGAVVVGIFQALAAMLDERAGRCTSCEVAESLREVKECIQELAETEFNFEEDDDQG